MAIQCNLTDKQSWLFVEAQWADLVVLAGSFRAGKTAAGLLWFIASQLQTPHRSLILRKKYQELDDIVRPEVEKWLPSQEIKRFRRNYPYELELRSGGVLLFRHLEKGIQDLRGVSVGSIFLDQAEDIPEEDFLYLFSRLSDAEGPRKMVLTMNPNGHDYLWRLARRGADVILPAETITFEDEEGREFIFKGGVYRKTLPVHFPDGTTEEVKISLIEMTAFENPHIPKDFLARELAFFDEKLVRRFVYLSWEEATGLVFPDFDPEIHLLPEGFRLEVEGKWSGGLDHGISAPTAFYLWSTFWDPNKPSPWRDPDDIIHTIGPEYYEANTTIYTNSIGIIDLVDTTAPRQRVVPIYCDPSIFAPVHEIKGKRYSDSEEYQRCGLKGKYSLRPARTRKTDQKISALRELFQVKDNRKHLVTGITGGPRVYIKPECPRLVEEIESLRIRDIGIGIMRGTLTEDKFERSPMHGIDANCYNAMSGPKPGIPSTGQAPKWLEHMTSSPRSPWEV